MQIKILGEHLTVTDSIRNYINHKISHLPVPDKISSCEFRIGKEREKQYIKFHAFLPNNEPIILNAHDNSLYCAIDKLIDKVHRNFVANKEKKHIHLYKH